MVTRALVVASSRAMRQPPAQAHQLGHRPRRLQLNATTISSWQVWQRARVKPWARMLQRR